MRKRLDLPLAQQIAYDPETGAFTRLISRSRSPAGSRCDTSLDSHGYPRVRVGGEEYRAHRLAWFMVHGWWPPADIDHINRIRNDNRLCNLRCATRQENMLNKAPRKIEPSKRAKGVYFFKRTGRWLAMLKIGKRKMAYLGYHATEALARECYDLAWQMTFG